MHTVVHISEKRVQLWITALSSAESACVSSVIKEIIPITLIVIAPSFLGMAALTHRETKSHRSGLIVVDAILAKS